jgi:hypothetical protein
MLLVAMSIPELAARSKTAFNRVPRVYLAVLALILAATAGFGLGYLEGQGSGGGDVPQITQLATSTPAFMVAAAATPPATTTLPVGGQVVASKSGTKYYLPWCGTVKLIKEENKVWFASREAAEAAGYEPASNCKGL